MNANKVGDLENALEERQPAIAIVPLTTYPSKKVIIGIASIVVIAALAIGISLGNNRKSERTSLPSKQGSSEMSDVFKASGTNCDDVPCAIPGCSADTTLITFPPKTANAAGLLNASVTIATMLPVRFLVASEH